MKKILCMLPVLMLLILPVTRQAPAGAIAVNTSKGAALVVVRDEELLALPEAELYHTLQQIIERVGVYAKPKA